MTSSYDAYGVPKSLKSSVREAMGHPSDVAPGLDEIIMQLGPHEVAHFLTTTSDNEAAHCLSAYLEMHWPDYQVLIERMMIAAQRDLNEELLSDLGQS